MTDDEPKIKASPNRRSRESAMMIPDLDYVRQRQAEMRDPEREARYQPGFRIDPPSKGGASVLSVEWNIQNVQTGEVLVPLTDGNETNTRERLDDLEKDVPGRYRLVSRVVEIGEWRPVT